MCIRDSDIDCAARDGILAMLHLERLVGIDRREIGELGAVLDLSHMIIAQQVVGNQCA